VGSTIGHTVGAGLSGMFGGQSLPTDGAANINTDAGADQQSFYSQQQQQGPASCEADAKAFTLCLEQNGNNVNACAWYLEALKQCQAMAKQY